MKIQVRPAAQGKWYWRIVADNNEILAVSETMQNKGDAEAIVAKVKAEASDSVVEIDD